MALPPAGCTQTTSSSTCPPSGERDQRRCARASVLATHDFRESLHRAGFEQRCDRQLQSKRAVDARDQRNRLQRRATEIEERSIKRSGSQSQRLLEQVLQCQLHRVARQAGRHAAILSCAGSAQCMLIDLAIRIQRQRRQQHEDGTLSRLVVAQQVFAQHAPLDRGTRHHRRHQARVAVSIVLRPDMRSRDGRVLKQQRGHRFRLHHDAADLDPVVAAPEEHDRAILIDRGEIAAAIDARARL